MSTNLHETFLKLVRLGIGITDKSGFRFQDSGFKSEDWASLKALAEEQGLNAIVLDGVESLPEQSRPPKEFLLQWIGEVLQDESTYSLQSQVARDIALLYYRNAIKMFVLKGAVVSECYPKPNHRVSADIDCYLLPSAEFKSSKVQEVQGDSWDAWSLGNDLIRAKGFTVNTDFYKNSSFEISGVNIENHQFFTPFRGNKKLKEFERVLHALMKQDHEDVIDGSYLYRPPVLVTALFLIEHAYSHFLHEGLTWRHVLDWMMFSRKHQKEILWADLEALVDEYGFKKFYDSYNRLGKYLLGEVNDSDLSNVDKKMLADVWAPLDLHDTVRGFKGKLALAGNTLRARWKYQYFADISMLYALWIQVKGFLFIREPKLI